MAGHGEMARHGTTTWTLHPGTLFGPKSPKTLAEQATQACRKVLAARKPLLLFRFVGTLLLRYAERTFDA